MKSNPEEKLKLEGRIRRIALLNAVRHDGKARVKPVIGRLLAEEPSLRGKVKEITPLVTSIVEEVNRLTPTEQRSILERIWPQALERRGKREKERVLPPLPNVDKYGRVVTRFAPNPDCVLHLGSARAIILSHEYARMYDGLFILRFEDTDPRLKRSALQFFDLIREDLRWLGCRWDEEYIQSDRLPIYYKYARKLIEDGNAYVCTCKPEDFRARVAEMEPCPCRNLSPEENLTRWEAMHDGTYGEGEAVLRIKTDLNHPNPAVRDWPAFRIIDTKRYPHPRVGDRYRVWPLYNFACGVDDHLMGITHIIRGKEHLTNQRRQEYLYRHLGWDYPEAIHYGRLKIVGAHLSKSKILQGVRSGIYKGWDDPRLATFQALRRRGIKPEAIRRLIIDIGPRAADITLSWENLYAINRKLVDPEANRYFFVQNPVKLTVRGIPEESIAARVPLHPDHPERGYRTLKLSVRGGEANVLISSSDIKLLEANKIIRLIGLLNLRVEEVGEGRVAGVFHSWSHEEARRVKAPLIHWIPAGTGIPCRVVMPDGSLLEGFVEETIFRVKVDTVVQFERFGFVRVDDVDGGVTVYFTHK
ncbi:glutamate--tRNA ligase [Candidatus Bathyarchaeota archaeon]|nr:MAG: glutamate--tRNA ligase [Candidatus Bathyarchaeota archaeon]